MRKIIHNIFRLLFIGAITIAAYHTLLTKLTEPKNNRGWTIDQKILSEVNIASSTPELIEINNIKNFSYLNNDEKQKVPNYYSDTFIYNNLKDVWFFQNDFVEPLGAHTFLTFEFEDGKYLSFSPEIRKEIGESYNPFFGLFRHYELHYMLVSERDILTLRADLREPPVFMYKLKLSRNEKINLFKNVLVRADKINKEPEFYNTYNNACTTNIATHLNNILDENRKFPNTFPTNWKIILPKYSDKFLYDHDLIDTGFTFSEIKSSAKINQKVKDAIKNNLNNVEFSQFIRKNYVENSKS